MKRTSTIVAIAATALLAAPVCFADTVNIVNATNYTCDTLPYSPSSCKQGTGSSIYASDATMQPTGDAIATGATAKPTIYTQESTGYQTVTIVAKNPDTGFTMPASQAGDNVKSGATFYAVTSSMMGGPAIVKSAP